jgi:HSP20 family protein
MKPQKGIEPAQAGPMNKPPESPVFVEAEKLIEQMAELTKAIARRAYEFFETRGGEAGGELEDWVRAESELVRPVPVTMKESEQRITVRAEVPGFKAKEIKIGVEPRRLIIEGRAEQAGEETSKGIPDKVIMHEGGMNYFHRSFALPDEIDPARVAASLNDGVLEITLPKIPERRPIGVEIKTA